MNADWNDFVDEIATATVDDVVFADLQTAVAALRNIDSLGTPDGIAAVQLALSQRQSAVALEAALTHVLPAASDVFTNLRDTVLPDVYRSAGVLGTGHCT